MTGSKPLKLPPETELEEEFLCSASGPGGQKINKTASAVRLTYRFMESAFLPDFAKEKLKTQLNTDFIMILARESRNLQDNRKSARERLSALLTNALKQQRKRKATKPTRASKQRRLEAKSKRSDIKAGRSRIKDF